MCSYRCTLYGSSEANPECLNPLDEEYEEIGGAMSFFLLMAIFCFMCMWMFALLSYRSQIVNLVLKELPEKIYSVWIENDEQGRGRTFVNDFALNDQCIWSHTHRMYLIGSNCVSHPWIIPKDFPQDALADLDRDRLIRFIDNYNPSLQWETFERYSFYIVSFLYYAMSKPYHTYLRE